MSVCMMGVCMHGCIHALSLKTRGVWGHASPGKLDALLRSFWDGSRAVVAVHKLHGSWSIVSNF